MKKIAIVGGGPGGLTLARLLQMHGFAVSVYERDVNRDVRVQGATLDLHDESGLRALREAGLMEAFEANYRPDADRVRITDKHATILLDEGVNNPDEHFQPEHFRPEIDRGPLRKILLDSLEPGAVVWDSHFQTMRPKGDGWRLTFKNATEAYADIVIAADGANSKIRPFITPIGPFYVGITAIEGAVYDSAEKTPGMHALLNGGKIFALDDDKTFIVSSKGDGSLAFYIGFASDEYWSRDGGIDFADKSQVLAWFQQAFAGWDEQWSELFRHSAYFIPRPQYCMPLDQDWTALPNLTMLGDAAHLMPPYAGEGVNMAMLDALELSLCLREAAGVQPAGPQPAGADTTGTHAAIARYERDMRARASATAKMTLEQTASLHSPGALAGMLALFGQVGIPPSEK